MWAKSRSVPPTMRIFGVVPVPVMRANTTRYIAAGNGRFALRPRRVPHERHILLRCLCGQRAARFASSLVDRTEPN
jgi:hypothetical protein